MITCKESVRFSVLRFEMISVLEKIFQAFRKWNCACIITCGTEGHPEDDPHPKGFALDFRSKHIKDSATKQAILQELRQTLGPVYTVILENEGLAQEHFHIQVRKDIWRTLL
jgi:hypothetical protein